MGFFFETGLRLGQIWKRKMFRNNTCLNPAVALDFSMQTSKFAAKTLREQCVFSLPDCRKTRYNFCVQRIEQCKAVLRGNKQALSVGPHTADSVPGLSVNCQTTHSGLRAAAFLLWLPVQTQREAHHFHRICNCQVVCPGKKRRRVKHVGK